MAKRIYDFDEAYKIAEHVQNQGHATFCLKDGTIYKGIVGDCESAADNDDNSYGASISVDTSPSGGHFFYAHQFAWAEFDDETSED